MVLLQVLASVRLPTESIIRVFHYLLFPVDIYRLILLPAVYSVILLTFCFQYPRIIRRLYRPLFPEHAFSITRSFSDPVNTTDKRYFKITHR